MTTTTAAPPQAITVTITGTNDTPAITAADSNAFTEQGPLLTDQSALDTVSGTISFTDVDLTDRPTVTTAFDSFTYQDASHTDVTLALSPEQQ